MHQLYAALPIHPDPFQRAQLHEVRSEGLIVGVAAVAAAWYFFARPSGALYAPGEAPSAREALAKILGLRAKAAAVASPRAPPPAAPRKAADAPAPAARKAAPAAPPPPPPRVAPAGAAVPDSLAAMLAEAEQLQARMDAEVGRLAALEAARREATQAELVAYAAALNTPAPRPERAGMDMAYPIKAAVAYAPMLPELAERLPGMAAEAAGGTVRRLAAEAATAAKAAIGGAMRSSAAAATAAAAAQPAAAEAQPPREQ